LRFADELTLPGAALPGFCILVSASIKMNWSGGATQINGVLRAALLTRLIRNSNGVPDPFSGVKSFE
jgi:hypothetical protein